ncbi:MAG: family N-acetyltransferase [Ferruginibacter sp.]|nr:family N-acetyltransferase [Ferruginibacter sp.]
MPTFKKELMKKNINTPGLLAVDFSNFPDLSTKRLILRCINRNDAAALLFLRSDPQVLAYLDKAPMETLEQAEVFIGNILENLQKNDAVFWVIALKENPGLMIGNICYWRIMKEHYRAEIGYMLQPASWNKGIMKEALQEVIRYGFQEMKLHSIEANINPDNVASQILLEKTGFIREGYFRENYYSEGKFTDSAIYSLLNK